MNILVVEDDGELAAVIRRFLEREKHSVVTCVNALDALDQARAEKFQLIITDLMLPHMDGISFVKKIRAEPRYETTPIIMISAYSDDSVLDESLRRGVAFVLPKPIDFEHLLSLLRFAQ